MSSLLNLLPDHLETLLFDFVGVDKTKMHEELLVSVTYIENNVTSYITYHTLETPVFINKKNNRYGYNLISFERDNTIYGNVIDCEISFKGYDMDSVPIREHLGGNNFHFMWIGIRLFHYRYRNSITTVDFTPFLKEKFKIRTNSHHARIMFRMNAEFIQKGYHERYNHRHVESTRWLTCRMNGLN